MQEIRASFFVECEELLESLQDGLQAMQDGATDTETVNIVFRAVHSIKGGAGAFGLDQLVMFAHSFETVMDELRAGRITADDNLLALFFQCGDLLLDLVRAARDDTELSEDQLAPVLKQLGEAVDLEPEDEEVDPAEFTPMALSLDLPGLDDMADLAEVGPPATPRYHIRFSPQHDLYTSGNEPLFLLRALRDFGQAEITCVVGDVPLIDKYDQAQNLLTWNIELESDVGEDMIREVFDFVDGLCELSIEPMPQTGNDVLAPALPDLDPPSAEDALPPLDTAPVEPAEPDPPAPEAETTEPAPPSKPASATTESGKSGGNSTAPKPTVRVDLERIDRLVNLVGELVINQSMLSQSVAQSGLSGNSQIAAGLDEFQQLTRDIQDSVMMIRAQPVKSLFQRMARIVRESASDVGKTVRLRTEGEATEIDKTVIERLADPLTHMIRNAVDHGLESTEKRLEAGKPAEGRVNLTASHRSGRVVIEVSDDGGGINRPKVKSIAEEKGLIPPDQTMSDSDIDNLLFMPGFSTASEISNLSGRGVGMDVVKNAISSLGGRITIVSDPGKGTTFSISLPLTLAVLDGMVVRVGTETLVVPLSAISETLSLRAGDSCTLGPNTQVVPVRDSFVPLIDLGTELGYSAPRESYEGAIVLLISQENGDRAAMVVDAIEDQRQVVIKGLQDSYGHVPGVAAATILGDGQIALILDPIDLLTNASGRSRTETAPSAEPETAEVHP